MHYLFNNVNYDEYKKMCSLKSYTKGSIIFNEGDVCDELGLIIKGEVHISTLTNNDKEYIISILTKDDIFGENLLFNDNKEYLGDCICNVDTTILFIKKTNLLKLFENKTILENYLHIISIKNTSLRQQIKLYSQKSIEDRIMFYLFSEQKRLNSNIINIISKEHLAKHLNIPRPSLSRELIKLKENGVIDYDKYSIYIN